MKDNKNILWFDIETAPECLTEVERATYPKRKLWEKKSETNEWIEWTFNWYIKKASVYPEFSKVVCVSFKLWDKVKTISIKDSDEKQMRVTAKVRYRAKDTSGVLTLRSDGTATMLFDEPVRAVTPGQSLVVYDGDYCLGGGTITS